MNPTEQNPRPCKFSLTIPSVGEDAEELELSYAAGENTKWYKYFGKFLAIC